MYIYAESTLFVDCREGKMKIRIYFILVLVLVLSTAIQAQDVSPYPEWDAYDTLIRNIKAETDFAERAKQMHQAEDMLMETGAIVPIFYYNDVYLQSAKVSGIYSAIDASKFFFYAKKEGDNTLKINLGPEPDFLDPALGSSLEKGLLVSNSFSGLYEYDINGIMSPVLAEGCEISEDGLTYTFTLKDGLKWSDGSDLTAEDFVYSWKRAADPKTGCEYSYMLDVIAGYEEAQSGDPDALQVSAPDAKTIVVRLNAPCAYFLNLTSFTTYKPVKQSAVEAFADWDTNPGHWAQEACFVTNGPYTLASWDHDVSMVYVKNPLWYDADNVSIERIEYMLSDDETAVYAAYRAGDLDFADSVPSDEIKSLLDSGDPEFHVIDQLATYYVMFNVKSPLFNGKTAEQANAMRQAFSILIDRQYITDTVTQTGEKIATSFIPAGMADGNGGIFKDASAWDYPVEDGYFGTEVDVKGAVELLKFAGFEFDENDQLSASTPISFEFVTNTSVTNQEIAECIQMDLAAVGINMKIRTVQQSILLDEKRSGHYDIASAGWWADFNDPINMLEMYTTNSGNNGAQLGRYDKYEFRNLKQGE